MEYAVHFSKGARGGPAACQLRGVFERDRPEEYGDGTAMAPGHTDGAADTGADRTRRGLASEASRLPLGETGAVRRACCLCFNEGTRAGKPLFMSPCACENLFVHRSCVQNRLARYQEQASCPSCKALYPVERRTKPIWKWFWEEPSREQAFMFAATVLFTVGNIGVVAMAWMYVLFEYRPPTKLPAALISSALFLVTIFWIGFTCFRIHTLYKPYIRWKQANTTLEVMLDEVSAPQV